MSFPIPRPPSTQKIVSAREALGPVPADASDVLDYKGFRIIVCQRNEQYRTGMRPTFWAEVSTPKSGVLFTIGGGPATASTGGIVYMVDTAEDALRQAVNKINTDFSTFLKPSLNYDYPYANYKGFKVVVTKDPSKKTMVARASKGPLKVAVTAKTSPNDIQLLNNLRGRLDRYVAMGLDVTPEPSPREEDGKFFPRMPEPLREYSQGVASGQIHLPPMAGLPREEKKEEPVTIKVRRPAPEQEQEYFAQEFERQKQELADRPRVKLSDNKNGSNNDGR